MSIYSRYVSGEDITDIGTDRHGHIKLRPLSGQFDVINGLNTNLSSEPRDLAFWKDVFARSVFYSGHDPLLFGDVITLVYKDGSKFLAVSITKFGFNVYENLLLDESSRFWPACQNLAKEHRTSYERKVLAISNLKNFNKLWNNRGALTFPASWDETNAGSLANSMAVIETESSEALGLRLLSMGLLQELNMASLLVDVVYDNACSTLKTVEENNKLVTILGTQMEQLFDPLLEYSPQALDYIYTPSPVESTFLVDSTEVSLVIDELVTVQTNYTMELVGILQDFIVPLRVNVLSDMSSTTLGVMKVNVVFPPTIDEITRINCILNNVLKFAAKKGCGEVFRVMASLLPFFYKAFARHQANIASFHSRFSKFLEHNEEYSFLNPNINRGNFTPKRLESIILDSIFELPKLKLIVQRLYNVIERENTEDPEFQSIKENYAIIVQTIDAFGRTDCVEKTKRIFTPTGKLLTELATGWPKSLQAGWMTRKVLAIYELENLLPEYENAHEILIIFSDHLLFLEVARDGTDKTKVPIPDVLMNSLINEKPLPLYSTFPKLRVKYWCGINSVLCKSFTSSSGQCLSFVSYGKNYFRTDAEIAHTINYRIIPGIDSQATCNKIMEHICKAQILHKSTPFHLFKCTDPDLTRFYCAHQYQKYSAEHAKSGIVILLNLNEDEADKILEESAVSIVICLSFYNELTIRMVGYNREKTLEISENICIELISASLKTTFAHCMDIILHSSTFTKALITSNGRLLSQLVALSAKPAEKADRASTMKSLDDFLVYPSNNDFIASEEWIPKVHEEPPKKMDKPKKSRFHAFILKLKKRNGKKKRSLVPTRNSLQNISNTGIPRGRKQNFDKLYKPNPELYEASTIDNESFTSVRKKSTEKKRVVSAATNTSSKYSNGSLDVNSRFEFPSPVKLGDIQEQNDDYDSANSGEYYLAEQDSLSPHDKIFPLAETNGSLSLKKMIIPPKLRDSIDYEYPSANLDEDITLNTEVRNSELSLSTPAHHIVQEVTIPETVTPDVGPEAGYMPEYGYTEPDVCTEPDVAYSEAAYTEPCLAKPAHTAPATVLAEPERISELQVDSEPQYREPYAEPCAEPVILEPYTEPVRYSEEEETVKDEALEKKFVPDKAKELLSQEQGIEKEFNPEKIPEKGPSQSEVPTHAKLKQEESKLWQGHRIAQRASRAPTPNLEQMVAIGKSSEIYAMYRMYNEIPSSIFSGDESANWVAFARDSYSNLQAELQAIEKEDAGFAKSLENSMRSLYHKFDSSNETSNFDVETFIKNSFSSNVLLPRTDESCESYQSLSSNYVREFGLGLDREFSLGQILSLGDFAQIYSPQRSPLQSPLREDIEGEEREKEKRKREEERKKIESVEREVEKREREIEKREREIEKRERDMERRISERAIKIVPETELTTSSEEYYSSQDFGTALEFLKIGEARDSMLITSSSSEKTLMNEYLYPPTRLKDEDPGDYNWVKITDIDDEIRDFGSMAYLSDILNGRVEI